MMHQPMGSYQTIFRARFSAITEKEINKAMATLVEPDWNQSRSVDARQELDLRIGCAFTRFQTMYFQSKYSDLDSALISYGPCQTPTLGFCVQRHDIIQSFKPEKYWMIDCKLSYGSCTLSVDWTRQRIFDREAALMFLGILQEHQQAMITDVSEKLRNKSPPVALNTVDMLRVASSQLHMGPQHVMHLAEKLYTQGYISYPRTETTKYPDSFDFHSILVQFKGDAQWREHVDLLLTAKVKCPKGGKDVGDHPPITPMKCASRHELSGDSWRLYEYIVQHFIGSLSPPCQFKVTQATFGVGGEEFTWSGTQPVTPGFTAVMTWMAVASHIAQVELAKGQNWDIKQLKVSEHLTNPPDYLSESELIGLMEKHGIGTDASISVHIENICQRNYVKVDSGRRLIPTKLGIVLVHGYQKIDAELVLPTMRSAVEEQLNLIALGRADFDSVLQHSLDIFGRKFHYFRSGISGMDELFEASFTSVAEGGKPLSRCGRCIRFMRYISAKPQRLYCNTCDETYALPQGGTVKLYKELKCPLDGFELVIFSTGPKGKTYQLCPFCYNQPPFPGVPKNMGCNHCPHVTCPHALPQLSVCDCSECEDGVLVLDPASGPCWRLACNNSQCKVVASLCEGAHRVSVTEQCCACGSRLVQVDFNKANTPLADGSATHVGCPYCDGVISSRMELHHSVRGHGRGRGRGRGGRRGNRRGRGSSGRGRH
ncbi:DNA topoisomerase 3-beta-1-like isoform X2 [Dysidea avara]